MENIKELTGWFRHQQPSSEALLRGLPVVASVLNRAAIKMAGILAARPGPYPERFMPREDLLQTLHPLLIALGSPENSANLGRKLAVQGLEAVSRKYPVVGRLFGQVDSGPVYSPARKAENSAAREAGASVMKSLALEKFQEGLVTLGKHTGTMSRPEAALAEPGAASKRRNSDQIDGRSLLDPIEALARRLEQNRELSGLGDRPAAAASSPLHIGVARIVAWCKPVILERLGLAGNVKEHPLEAGESTPAKGLLTVLTSFETLWGVKASHEHRHMVTLRNESGVPGPDAQTTPYGPGESLFRILDGLVRWLRVGTFDPGSASLDEHTSKQDSMPVSQPVWSGLAERMESTLLKAGLDQKLQASALLQPSPMQAGGSFPSAVPEVTLNSNTEIHVETSDPSSAAREIAEHQKRVNAEIIRKLRGVVR